MSDINFPGERASFTPAASEIVMHDGAGRQLRANVTPLSIEEQRAIHHNQLRYGELQRLRLGQPNLYNESRYR